MAIVVFCDNCRRERNWPKPSLRTSTAPCDICHGWDAYRTRRHNRVTGAEEIETVKLNNFENDARFLPGTAQEAKLQEPLV